jgi:hypothetical protein
MEMLDDMGIGTRYFEYYPGGRDLASPFHEAMNRYLRHSLLVDLSSAESLATIQSTCHITIIRS